MRRKCTFDLWHLPPERFPALENLFKVVVWVGAQLVEADQLMSQLEEGFSTKLTDEGQALTLNDVRKATDAIRWNGGRPQDLFLSRKAYEKLSALAAAPPVDVKKPNLQNIPKYNFGTAVDYSKLEKQTVEQLFHAGVQPLLNIPSGPLRIAVDPAVPPDQVRIIQQKGATLLKNVGPDVCKCAHKRHRHGQFAGCELCSCGAFEQKLS